MRSVLIGSLRVNTRRYVATALAVVVAVAFIIWTNALLSSAQAGMSSQVEEVYRNVDLVATVDSGASLQVDEASVVDEFVAKSAELGGTADVFAVARAQVTGPAGIPVGANYGATIAPISSNEDTAWQTLSAGRLPKSSGEVVVDAKSAERAQVGLGDVLCVATDNGDALKLTVVGIAENTSAYGGASLYMPWQSFSKLSGPWIVAMGYRAGPHAVGIGDARQQLSGIAGVGKVEPKDEFVATEVTNSVTAGLDILGYMALIFAAIASFVAVMVIANTFTIVFAQRSGDFALLRCVGATRRQVRRAVRIEALVLALVAAALGVGLGIVGGIGLVVGLRQIVDRQWLGDPSFSPLWLSSAFAVGVAVTVLAAWWPTHRVTSVPPLAALRPEVQPVGKTRAGWIRIGSSVFLGVAGSVLLYLAIEREDLPYMIAGGLVTFMGVIGLGPVIVPALVRAIAPVVGLLGLPLRLAATNALRNPRRTASTTATLLVGVALTTAILTGVASVRSSTAAVLDSSYPVDVMITSTSGLPADIASRATEVKGVDKAVALQGARVDIGGQEQTVVVADAAAAAVTHDPGGLGVADDEVLVPYTSPLSGEKTLTIDSDSGSITLETVVIDAGFGDSLIVAHATLGQLGVSESTMAVWARTAPNADAAALASDLGQLAGPDAMVTGGVASRQMYDKVLTILTASVLGLLGISIVIALIGIANTLGLSVLERQRENALLRALGLTRRQMRRTLASEGALISLVAVIIGGALGLVYAWVGVQTLVTQLTTNHVEYTVPWMSLMVVGVLAMLAGVVAAALPGRRASRISPAEGLVRD